MLIDAKKAVVVAKNQEKKCHWIADEVFRVSQNSAMALGKKKINGGLSMKRTNNTNKHVLDLTTDRIPAGTFHGEDVIPPGTPHHHPK
jgi:hypothetical protein